MPRRDRLGRHPHRQAAAVAQRDLVLPPVLHPVPGFWDLVAAGLVMLVRHRNHRPGCWRQVHHPTPATYPCRTLPICAPTPPDGVFLQKLAISFQSGVLITLGLTSTSRTSPSASTARHR